MICPHRVEVTFGKDGATVKTIIPDIPYYGIIEHTNPEPTQSELVTRDMITVNIMKYLGELRPDFRAVRLLAIVRAMIWSEDAYKLYKEMFSKMN